MDTAVETSHDLSVEFKSLGLSKGVLTRQTITWAPSV